MRILAPTRYGWRFNSPRKSRHLIENRPFAPFNKIDARFEGGTFYSPLPLRTFDLVHAFNRIPLGFEPYVIGFESHLPRGFNYEDSAYYRLLRRSLSSERCRGIFAISEHAKGIFEKTHEGPDYAHLASKLHLRYPNVPIFEGLDPLLNDPLTDIRITFVGAHFARKGGCVAVRVAQMARERGLPLTVQIVSKLEFGAGVWTDPTNPKVFEPYVGGLTDPNIVLIKGLDNAGVIQMVRNSHFTLLATFGDTFGYSAIESMANYTPVIGTRQGALPEFIEHDRNGVLLDLDTNDRGEWIYAAAGDRSSPKFEQIFRDEIERLARETLAAIEAAVSDKGRYRFMRTAAHKTASDRFNPTEAAEFWDDLYDRSLTH